MLNIAEQLGHLRGWLLGRAYNLFHANNWPKEIEPEDLVSAATARALRHRSKFKGTTTAELRSWLLKVMRSEIGDQCDYYNAKKRRSSRVFSIDEILTESQARTGYLLSANLLSVSTEYRKQEAIDRMFEAIELLAPSPREILLMRYRHKLEIREMASRLNISEAAVTLRLVRATKKLAESIQRDDSK